MLKDGHVIAGGDVEILEYLQRVRFCQSFSPHLIASVLLTTLLNSSGTRKYGSEASELVPEASLAADETSYSSMIANDLKDVEVRSCCQRNDVGGLDCPLTRTLHCQIYAQWCFPGSYSATKRRVAALTIFPLSMVLPSYMKRDHMRRLMSRRIETPRQVRAACHSG